MRVPCAGGPSPLSTGRPAVTGQPVLPTGVFLQTTFERAQPSSELAQISSELAQISSELAQISTTGATLRVKTDALPLVSDSSFGPVELRLAPSRTFRGRVVSPLGAVVSASLEIVAGDGLPIRSQARTDLSGEFSADIPADATRARIAVLAPGRALQAFIVPVDSEPTLNLSSEAGDIEVEAPWLPEAQGRERGTWLAVQNGLPLPMPFLYQWVELQNGDRTALGREGKIRIGQLPPAAYQFCNVTATDLIAFELTGSLPPGAVCAEGALAAGGTLQLNVPAPKRSGK